jgi:hypothetical protein
MGIVGKEIGLRRARIYEGLQRSGVTRSGALSDELSAAEAATPDPSRNVDMRPEKVYAYDDVPSRSRSCEQRARTLRECRLIYFSPARRSSSLSRTPDNTRTSEPFIVSN